MSDLQATYHVNDVMSVATTSNGSGVISFITNNKESFIQSGEVITSGSGNKLNFTKINEPCSYAVGVFYRSCSFSYVLCKTVRNSLVFIGTKFHHQ